MHAVAYGAKRTTPPEVAMTKKPKPLSDEALAMIARRFTALSDPLRLRLLHSLFDGEKNVTALVELSGGTQTNVSRHLQTLADAGILARRKDGLQVFYSIADPTIYQLCELVCCSLEKTHTARAGQFAGRGRG